MKTITYGFFIYVSLTTIYGVSAYLEPVDKRSPTQTKLKCDLLEVIKASEHTEECKNITSFGTEALLPPLTMETVIPHLCTGIIETANTICELNLKPTFMNSGIFKKAIEKLQPVANNLTKFCYAMNRVVSNSTRSLMINSTSYKNIVQLNKYLTEGCRRICWKNFGDTSANPLCSVLLWENEIIANFTSNVKPTLTKPQTKPLDNGKKFIANQTQQELISGHGTQAAAEQPTIKEMENSLTKDKAQGDGNKKEENSKENKQEKTPAPASVAGKNEADKNARHETLETENILREENQNVKHVPGGGNSGKIEHISGEKSPQIAGQSEIGTKPDVDQVENNGPNNNVAEGIKIHETAGTNKKMEVESDDNGEKVEDIGEDEEAGIPDNIDPPPVDDKKMISNAATQIQASSNHGKEDKSDGQENAATDQESTGPREHSLTHSGPLDPPQHFFAYFMAVSFICLLCYIGYHKKHKIMAIIFEGRKSRSGRGRRRPNTAGYRKLDCNLEEAVTSQCNSNVTHVIY